MLLHVRTLLIQVIFLYYCLDCPSCPAHVNSIGWTTGALCSAIRNTSTLSVFTGTLTKPIVAWCIGTCARMFTSEVQFGHAGSCAQADSETATAKNDALRNSGAVVPQTFDDLGTAIK